MDRFLASMGTLGAGDVIAATAAWSLVSKVAARRRLVRVSGSMLGGMVGALIAEPQVTFVVDKLGSIEEAAGLKIVFALPFLVPLTTGLAAWLFSEILGGRTRKPLRSVLSSVGGAAFGVALVVLLGLFLSPAPAWISYPILLTVPAAGSTLAIMLSARGALPPNQALNLPGLRPAG